MKLRYTPLAALGALALFIGACSDETPSGNNNLDPTLAINPCDSAFNPAVGANGFVMSGSGYQGQRVALDATPDIEFNFFLNDAAIIYQIDDTVDLSSGQKARIFFDAHVPSSLRGTFPFNTQVGDSASKVRIEIRVPGLQTRVFRSGTDGRITLDSFISGSQPFIRFCGTLQDSTSRAQLAIMSGHLSPQ